MGNPSWHVIAGAGIAGPYDIADIEFPLAMTGAASGDSLYLTNLALCYSTYYRQPLESVLKLGYAAKARVLRDGDHADDLAKSLPTNPRELFTPEFLTAFDRKQPHRFLNAARGRIRPMPGPRRRRFAPITATRMRMLRQRMQSSSRDRR